MQAKERKSKIPPKERKSNAPTKDRKVNPKPVAVEKNPLFEGETSELNVSFDDESLEDFDNSNKVQVTINLN